MELLTLEQFLAIPHMTVFARGIAIDSYAKDDNDKQVYCNMTNS